MLLFVSRRHPDPERSRMGKDSCICSCLCCCSCCRSHRPCRCPAPERSEEPASTTPAIHYQQHLRETVLTNTTEAAPKEPETTEQNQTETPLESLASICTVLAIGLFVMTFIFQNFEIPSASMEKTLLIGDHVLVDRITLAPPSKWAPFVFYRPVHRGDIIVFLKPNPETPDLYLVKRAIAIPGDHLHLRDGVVYLNGVAQNA